MARTITISVFAKSRTSKNGTRFLTYSGRLNKKDGSYDTVRVKFRKPCEGPEENECPLMISFEQDRANLSTRYYTDNSTGELRSQNILWISEYAVKGAYIDHSLDDYC